MVKVTASMLQKDGKILIAQRKAEDKLAHKWEFPGGKIKDNEAPEQCLKRELKEEFDVDVSVGEYLGSSIVQDTLKQIGEYDFAPADIPFVKKLRRGEIEL